MYLDTLGNEIKIGDIICFSGKGNKDAEYGMITGIITNIQKDKIKYNRLDVKYPDHKNPVITVVNRSKEYGKFVKVTSYPAFIEHWLNGNFQGEEKRIAKWIHKGIINEN